jgi:hypothetical protein
MKTLIVAVSLTTIAGACLTAQQPDRQRDATGRPLVPATAVEDYTLPVPPRNVLNFADTFTVARRADGTCDWSKVPARPGKRGTSSYLGERHAATCSGVVYNVTDPPRANVGIQSDITVMVAPSVWEGRDTTAGRGRQARDVVNAVQRRLGSAESVTSVTFQSGDTTARVMTTVSPTRVRFYSLRKRNGGWEVISSADVPNR